MLCFNYCFHAIHYDYVEIKKLFSSEAKFPNTTFTLEIKLLLHVY